MSVFAMASAGSEFRPPDSDPYDYAVHEDGRVLAPSGYLVASLTQERVRQIKAQVNFGMPSDAMMWAFSIQEANTKATARDGRPR